MEEKETFMSRFGKDLVEALSQALDHAKGKAGEARSHTWKSELVDVRSTRRKLKLTQQRMAMLLGVSLSGYRKWEQGERQPSGAARTLLMVMEREPQAVLKAILH
jgi:putative transcriptional regulator